MWPKLGHWYYRSRCAVACTTAISHCIFDWLSRVFRSYSGMLLSSLKSALHHVRYLPLWSALTVVRWRSFESRSRGLGTTFGVIMRWFPPARRRFDREVSRVFPEMTRSDRLRLGQEMGRQMGRTLFEIYHDAEFQTQHHKFNGSGPGLDAMKDAQARGKGVIIVSGHFGQWEAVRAVVKMHGLESGAVYRPNNNRHYERRIRTGIEAGSHRFWRPGASAHAPLYGICGRAVLCQSCWMKNTRRVSGCRFLGMMR